MNLRDRLGLAKSKIIYRNYLKLKRLGQFYSRFIDSDSLCFDIGSHVGDRTTAWTRLGARVVALEPQRVLYEYLTDKFRNNAGVRVLPFAVGAHGGKQKILKSPGNPTLATLSETWVESVSSVESFHGISWLNGEEVEVTTLDQLISQFGVPDFVKIDVEGFEYEVLSGVSHPLPFISFEFLPAAVSVATQCLEIVDTMGTYQFNVSVGEKMRFQYPEWVLADEIHKMLNALNPADRSGDIYARMVKD